MARLRGIIGQDLRALADELGVTVWKDGKLNKGWAGHTIERILGLSLNCSRAPDFGSWELKLVSLKRNKNGQLCVKETMAITMLDPKEVARQEFEGSHLFTKLRKGLVAARIFEGYDEARSILYSVGDFDLDDPVIYRQVKADYDVVRHTLCTRGCCALTGKMGVLVQPRTKGPGHGSKSRAFYARKCFVAHIVGLVPYNPPSA
jgi:DNA mismatch repair protein MutH